MHGVSKQVFKERVKTTLESIGTDAEAGKLNSDEDTHPFSRVSELPDEFMGLETEDMASLLVERLVFQGYQLFFSAEAAKRNFDIALARAEKLTREAKQKEA